MANIAVKCIDLEIQIAKLQNTVDKAKSQDALQSLNDKELENEMEAEREIIKQLQDHCDEQNQSTIQPLKDEVETLTQKLQEGISQRDKLLVEEHDLKEQIETYEINTLEMESVMEQTKYYQTELETLYHNLRMNLEQNRIDLHNEKHVTLRSITNTLQQLQHQWEECNEINQSLSKKCIECECITKDVKETAQRASSDNDALQDKLIEAEDNRKLWSYNKNFLERVASDHRLNMQSMSSEWAPRACTDMDPLSSSSSFEEVGGMGGMGGIGGGRVVKRSAEIETSSSRRRRSLDFLPKLF